MSPTTTTPPTTTSPPTTVPTTGTTLPLKPGEITVDGTTYTVTGGSYAGGVDPNYLGLEKQSGYMGATTATPYAYTTQDWQTILQYAPDKVETIQRQLMKAFPGFTPGILGDKTDPKTIKYFKLALGRINSLSADTASPLRGQKIDAQLTALSKMPAAVDGGGGGGMPSFQLNNPDDLKAVFKKAAQDSLGHNLGEGDLNKLIESYQALQLQYQKQVSSGGTTVQAPNAQTFATTSIEKDFGDEVNTQKLDGIFSAIDEALSGEQ
tara:strand:+ start:466 stop:1260 length:795 start_codon:yes stop_codon:yes gene_type:complete